jgi:hypothetical protein
MIIAIHRPVAIGRGTAPPPPPPLFQQINFFLQFVVLQWRSQDEKRGEGHEPKYFSPCHPKRKLEKLLRGGGNFLHSIYYFPLCLFQLPMSFWVYFILLSGDTILRCLSPAPFYTEYCTSALTPLPPKIHKMYTFLDWNTSSSFQNKASLHSCFFLSFFFKVETTIKLWQF